MAWLWVVRSLWRHRLRTALSLAGLAVTCALLLDMIMLGGGLDRSFMRLLLSRGYQIRISPRGTLPFDTEATIPGFHLLADSLQADPRVASVAPLLGGAVFVRRGDSLVTLFGYGVLPEARLLYDVEAGHDLAPGDSAGLLVSTPAQEQAGLAIGDTVTLLGRLDPQQAAGAVRRIMVVRGRVRWLYDPAGQPSIGGLFPVMQQLTGRGEGDRVSAIAVKVRSDAEVDAVVRRYRARFPDLEVNSVADMAIFFRQRLVYFQQLSRILGTISLVITLLLVSTLLTVTVNERLGEIATLRAIGLSRAHIVRQVVAEGAVLTVIGGVIGTGLGLVTAHYLDAILKAFPGLPAAVSFFVVRPGSLLAAALVFVLSGLLAGAYPAWLAARLPIAATLRAEAP